MSADTVVLVFGAYVLGAIPFLYLLGRLSGVDLRDEGSRNVGGTNLWRTVGPFTGVLGAVSDIGKGVAPVLVARSLEFNDGIIALAAIAAVAGQCWPVFLRFHGGRGISVVAGAVLALSPMVFVLAVIPAVAGLAAYYVMGLREQQDATANLGRENKESRTVPLFMMFSIVALPFIGYALEDSSSMVLSFAALSLMLLLRRLTAGLRHDRGSQVPLSTRLRNRLLYDRAQV